MYNIETIDTKPLIVGECPLWDKQKNILYTIDIRGKCIRALDWINGEHRETVYAQEIGCIALTEDGSILAAMQDGVYLARGTGEIALFCKPEKLLGRRFNDGKVGPDGRFYVGTTDVNGEGAFYRIDYDGTATLLFDHVACSNGLAWSGDGKTLYYCDSPKKVLEAFDFDQGRGLISSRRTIMKNPCKQGEFDGMTVDAEGMLWVAVWGDSCVLRIDPAMGAVLERVDLPASRISCCGFAGEKLDRLIITSAAYQADSAEEPMAGHTFAIKTAVSGRPAARFVLYG